METSVPPFFHPTSSEPDSSRSYPGVFRHRGPVVQGDAHVRWWPSRRPDSLVQTVVLFIPGNPGLLDFYTPFLSMLHQSFCEDGLAVLAHAHLGHTPHFKVETASLMHQVEAALETFDAIKTYWPNVKVVLIGHSVGSWMATQVLKARPDTVDGLFLLFPTISHIAKTPNGRRLSWLFRAPVVSLLAQLSVIIRPIAAPILSLLFPSWPTHQKTVLRSLVCSRKSIHASLTMAHEEMRTITELDVALLKQHSSKLWFYYAIKDNWVGSERENVVKSLASDVPSAIQVVHCQHGVPHAFCILHGDIIATQCTEWLRQGALVGEERTGT